MKAVNLICGLFFFYATIASADPRTWADTFGYDDGGWEPEHNLQILADVNADDQADVIGFGDDGVHVSLSTGNGFAPPLPWLDNFGRKAGNWQRQRHPRFVVDVNADKRADIVGFGDAGVYVSLSTGSQFTQPELWLDNFSYKMHGWRLQRHPRFVVDVNADQRADVIGFGAKGVYVSLSTGSGFAAPTLWIDLQGEDSAD